MKTHTARIAVIAALLSLGIGACGVGEADPEDELEAGFKLDDEATAAEVGLQTYPGSKAYREEDDSSSGANVRLSTPWFGMKVVALNLETPDEPKQIAAFYRQALSKYGDILDCSDPADRNRKSRSSDDLTCDRDDSRKHSVVLKVGTEENQRIVAIKPHGNGTRFSLVHVDVREKSNQ